jgi:hypothetical protein
MARGNWSVRGTDYSQHIGQQKLRGAATFALGVLTTSPLHGDALAVSFQEVVHPVLNGEAEVVEALANPGRTEWTLMRMPL